MWLRGYRQGGRKGGLRRKKRSEGENRDVLRRELGKICIGTGRCERQEHKTGRYKAWKDNHRNKGKGEGLEVKKVTEERMLQ